MDTVRIERFTSRVHAELACSMLTAHGLNARVSGDDVGGVHPDIPYGIGGTAIVVPRDQLEEANALLDEEFAGSLGDTDADDDAGGLGGDEVGGDEVGGDEVGPGSVRSVTDGSWTATGRTAERRTGLRVFAVVAAIVMATIFFAVTGGAAGWWG